MTTNRRPAPRTVRARLRGATRLAVVRGRFAVLQRVAPDRAVAAALDLWCTVPGNAGRRRDLRPGPGQVLRVAVPRGGHAVAETWGEGPLVYLVHGWGGWRGQLGAFVAPLVAAGYSVVGVDAPGHGDADDSVLGPGRSTAMEMIEALAAVADVLGPAEGVIAHSLGSTAAAVVVHEGLAARRLVLIAPNDSFGAYTRQFGDVVGLDARTLAGMEREIEAFCRRPLTDFDVAPLGADGSMPETLVVHDRFDKETPLAVGLAVADAWPTARAVVTEGLGHQRILADDGVVALAVDHVRGLVPVPE